MVEKPTYKVAEDAIMQVKEGRFVTMIGERQVPAEIGEYGPPSGALVFFDPQGNPLRAIFLESIG